MIAYTDKHRLFRPAKAGLTQIHTDNLLNLCPAKRNLCGFVYFLWNITTQNHFFWYAVLIIFAINNIK
jgi:hypothetical protein